MFAHCTLLFSRRRGSKHSISFWIRGNPSISTDTLIRLTELVLNLNTFEFNGNFFEQVSGVGLGTKMGPRYACLFMGYLEIQILEEYTKNKIGPLPLQYLRYIDDGIDLFDTHLEDINRFIDYVSNFHINRYRLCQ
jgi:hypothetical protein